MPGDGHRDAERGECNQQDDLARSGGLIPGIGDSAPGKFEMAIADSGGQRDRTP